MKTIVKNTNLNRQELGKIYLWTAAIHRWKSLLYFPEQKELIINSLKSLHEKSLVTIYAYVIMPNHIHMIWKQNKINGKEMPGNSFLKHIAKELQKKLNYYGKNVDFNVEANSKTHQIWQADSFSIELYSKRFILKKMNDLHEIPTKGRWKLCKSVTEYKYSSANFYSTGIDETGILNNILV
jgi:REP element-mobilizing transposase RayT